MKAIAQCTIDVAYKVEKEYLKAWLSAIKLNPKIVKMTGYPINRESGELCEKYRVPSGFSVKRCSMRKTA